MHIDKDAAKDETDSEFLNYMLNKSLEFINKILSFVIGGNPLPSGGGRSLTNP